MRPQGGFTLVELLVTVTVAAILLGYGVPGFRDLIRNSRASAAANEIVTALQYARSEAVRRGAAVDVCRSNAAGNACENGTNWRTGWRVMQGVTLLRAGPAAGDATTVTGPATNVQFRASGVPVAAAAFSVVPDGCHDDGQRSITVALTGRIAVARTGCP